MGSVVEPGEWRPLLGQSQQLARAVLRQCAVAWSEVRPRQRSEPPGHRHVGPWLRWQLSRLVEHAGREVYRPALDLLLRGRVPGWRLQRVPVAVLPRL